MNVVNVPIPTAGQLRWLDAELGLFLHFGINTFADKEWSDGTVPAERFNPTALDARQWVREAVAGGFRYIMLTAKHHDGFCLWPTRTTDYSVRSSPWNQGQGDVVAELAAACREAGMPLGLYLSPWDRHEPCYADKSAYDRFYERQLTELCSNYGELFALWFDGAGSEGREYDWDSIMSVTSRLQPNAMIFNMGHPTTRWVGNEDGVAHDPNYLCVNAVGKSVFADPDDLTSVGGLKCLPPECPVAIRLNWFWHRDDLHTLKSAENLLAIYYRSVGMGANLLLNMGPDVRGLLSKEDIGRWREVRQELDRRFSEPVRATLQPASNGLSIAFNPQTHLDHLVLREDLSRGQRIDGFTLSDANDGRVLATGRTVGHKRIIPFDRTCTDRLDLRLDGTPDARLRDATGYLTGHSSLPSLGDKVNYKEWAKKADTHRPEHV